MSLMLAWQAQEWAWAADLDDPHVPAEIVSEKRHRKYALHGMQALATQSSAVGFVTLAALLGGRTGVAGVTPKSAAAVEVYRVVCGTNLLMFCVSVEPSVVTLVSSTCACAHAASASKAKAATAVLLAILAPLCRQQAHTLKGRTHT